MMQNVKDLAYKGKTVSEKNDTTSGADRFTTVKEPSWKDYKEEN